MLHEKVESTEKVSPIILHAQGYKIKTGKEGEKVRFGAGGFDLYKQRFFFLAWKIFLFAEMEGLQQNYSTPFEAILEMQLSLTPYPHILLSLRGGL